MANILLSYPQVTDNSDPPPLDGVTGHADQGATMFQYYLKIVPTTYARADGSLFLTNQFSVTRHQKVIFQPVSCLGPWGHAGGYTTSSSGNLLGFPNRVRPQSQRINGLARLVHILG